VARVAEVCVGHVRPRLIDAAGCIRFIMDDVATEMELQGYVVWQGQQSTAAMAGSSGSSLWPETQQLRQALASGRQFFLHPLLTSITTAWLPSWA
jgi:hypothetical protein